MTPLLYLGIWLAIGVVVSFVDAFYASDGGDIDRSGQKIIVWPLVVIAWIVIGLCELSDLPIKYARKLRARRNG